MKIKPENLYLSSNENTILRLLSEGKSYVFIRKHLQIVSSNFPMLLSSLRRKTGMTGTRDPDMVANYLQKCRESFESPEMTPEQMRVFRKVAAGGTLLNISYNLQKPEKEVRELLEQALFRAGIFASHAPTIRVQCKTFLAAQELRSGAMPPLEMELRIMRAVTTSKSYAVIAMENGITESYARECFRKGCSRAQLVSRGRGSMIALARIFLSFMDARKREQEELLKNPSVTMDDPSF